MERASVISEAMEVGSVLMVAECRGVARAMDKVDLVSFWREMLM